MIIVFFHVLYLFSRFIYKNYVDNNNFKDDDGDDGDGKQMRPRNVDPYSRFYDEEEETVRFSPPAYIQRYDAVATVLTDDKFRGKIRKVVDFGCSELGFVQHLKNTHGIEEVLCVDIDRDTLDRNKKKIEPLTADYLISRSNPLTITTFEGSVTESDQCLEGCDAVIAIELIEHLYPETLIDLPYNIFGFIQPLVAIFTTPNSEFNVLFKTLKGFRHPDHKFEWTREQFQDWAINLTRRYPSYKVTFRGIARGPAGTESLGSCSQMAIFMRTGEKRSFPGTEGLFKVAAIAEYPFRVDSRSDEEKILHEAEYYIRRYALNNEDEEMSLDLLAKWMDTVSVDVLRETLQNNGWDIVEHPDKGFAVLCQAFTEYSEYGEDDDEDLLSNDVDNFYDNNDVENHYDTNWDNEPGPPAYRHEDWPEIYDQDEDDWDNDLLQEGLSHTSAQVSIATNENSSARIDSAGSAMSEGNCSNELPGYSVDINVSGSESNDSPYGQGVVINGQMTQDQINGRIINASPSAQREVTVPSPRVNHQVCDVPVRSSEDDGLQVYPKTSFPSVMSKSEHNEDGKLSPIDVNKALLQGMPSPIKPENGSPYCSEIASTCSSCQKEKLTVLRKLKGNLLAESPKNTKPGSEKLSLCLQISSEASGDATGGHKLAQNEHSEPSSSSSRTLKFDSEDVKSDRLRSVSEDDLKKQHGLSDANQDFMKSINEILQKDKLLKDSEEKLHSGPRESPPNSWSPEVMDSGYPNTSSANDITPEYDLSSIAQDRILESESPSLAEPPRPNFEQFEQNVVVENGDLANNNRDGEGNNLGPAEVNDLEDLQPLIDGLENDLENENDIYDFQNGFPMWLLRILDVDGHNRQEVARMREHRDEGFDGSSSEDERADENENID